MFYFTPLKTLGGPAIHHKALCREGTQLVNSSHLEVLVHAVTTHLMLHLMRNITGERNKPTFWLQNKQVRKKKSLGRKHIPLGRHVTTG